MIQPTIIIRERVHIIRASLVTWYRCRGVIKINTGSLSFLSPLPSFSLPSLAILVPILSPSSSRPRWTKARVAEPRVGVCPFLCIRSGMCEAKDEGNVSGDRRTKERQGKSARERERVSTRKTKSLPHRGGGGRG